MSVDADEVLSTELRGFIEAFCTKNAPKKRASYEPYKSVEGFLIKRRLVFLGRKLRFGKTVDYPLRFFKKGSGSFNGAIHEHFDLARSRPCKLPLGELLHYSYEDLSDYFNRFNLYTSRIAQNHIKTGRKMPWRPFHILRPWTEFLVRYFFRLGFLDGYPGYCYAVVSCFYTFIKYAKLLELSQKEK